MANLKGIRVAVPVTDGFERVELVEPRHALDQAGAARSIVAPKSILDIVAPGSAVAPKSGYVRGWKFVEWGEGFRIGLDAQPYNTCFLSQFRMAIGCERITHRRVAGMTEDETIVRRFTEDGK